MWREKLYHHTVHLRRNLASLQGTATAFLMLACVLKRETIPGETELAYCQEAGDTWQWNQSLCQEM